MNRRRVGYLIWLALAAGLYFFENGPGTRAALCCTLLLPLAPRVREALFSPDRARTSGHMSVSARSFSLPEENATGDVRPYRPGDPINRMHWKLSAKRGELLLREVGPEAEPEDEMAQAPAAREGGRAGLRRKRALWFCLTGMVAAAACLALIPAARLGAQVLCNRLFAASERVNAYVYDRFPVPDGQAVAPAAPFLAALPALLIAMTLLSGSRLLALAVMAGCAAFQMYFGLAFPGWANAALLAAFALWTLRRPWRRGDVLALLAWFAAVSLAVLILFPGVDAATEAASERARDALSRAAQQTAGALWEADEGENAARHTHSMSLVEGEGEARTERAYRLETVEEQQISRPHWIDYLRIALLLLAAAALVVLPFLPFLWLGARRRKALEARAAFASDNVSEAVCAIFRHAAAWLTAMGAGAGNLLYRDWAARLPAGLPEGYPQRFEGCARLFEEAAYSDHVLGEDQRRQALSLLDETEQALLARADWKQKLRLKYGECLWTEKA